MHRGKIREDFCRSKVQGSIFEFMDPSVLHAGWTWFDGLPEQKIERVEMKRVRVSYAENAMTGQPAMMDGIDRYECFEK